MTSILFKRTPHAYLPEVSAYKAFLARHFPQVKTFEVQPGEKFNPDDYDVVWHFMGLDQRAEGRYVVHEYNSLSTGMFPGLKNMLKKGINGRPDARVFLNETVREGFSFKDDVPSYLRDMGIDDAFFQRGTEKKYDFVYAGGTNRRPGLEKALDRFSGPLKKMNILMIGKMSAGLMARYKDSANIIFTGQVPYSEVPNLMASARYGLNFMPDRYPFNRQTATKVLEYCALGLPVISTRYYWIENFKKQRDGRFFWLDESCGSLTEENIRSFDFRTPDVSDLSWDAIIDKSGIFSFLK